eukprot:1181925-Prorocentrum_minimum.AAC.5
MERRTPQRWKCSLKVLRRTLETSQSCGVEKYELHVCIPYCSGRTAHEQIAEQYRTFPHPVHASTEGHEGSRQKAGCLQEPMPTTADVLSHVSDAFSSGFILLRRGPSDPVRDALKSRERTVRTCEFVRTLTLDTSGNERHHGGVLAGYSRQKTLARNHVRA